MTTDYYAAITTGQGHPMQFDELGNGDRMAGMRTNMAFHRTRMAADRTLMAIMRTALSMIGFGFTLYTFVTNFIKRDGALGLLAQAAPVRFAVTMIVLGTLLLALGILNDYRYMARLKAQRAVFIGDGLLPPTDDFPRSLTLVTAVLLLLIGLVTTLGIIFRSGPFN